MLVQDVVVCALNLPENTMVGDACPPGTFVVGRLDAIDTMLHAGDKTVTIRYNGISPVLNQFYGAVEDGGYMMLSTTSTPINSSASSGGAAVTSTKIQEFKVLYHWLELLLTHTHTLTS